MTPKVIWGMAGYGPLPYMPVYSSHMRAIAYAAGECGIEFFAAGATDRMYTSTAENQIAQELLDSDATHVFMTELDMILPKHTIPTLLELDRPIVSGVYFLRNGNGQPCLYKKVVSPTGEENYGQTPVSIFPQTTPFRVGCPGLGCVLISREVFERLPFPWFDLAEKKYGSDMYFYKKCADAGIEIWAHPGVMCDQIDYTVVGIEDYRRRLKRDPKFAAHGFIINEGA